MPASLKLYNAREVAEILGLSADAARRIMINEMQTIQTGRNPENPRYKVTLEEIERWQKRSAAAHCRPSPARIAAMMEERAASRKKPHLIPRRPYTTKRMEKEESA